MLKEPLASTMMHYLMEEKYRYLQYDLLGCHKLLIKEKTPFSLSNMEENEMEKVSTLMES